MGRTRDVSSGFFFGSVVTMGVYYCYLWLVQPDVMRKFLQGRRDRPCDLPDDRPASAAEDGDDDDGGAERQRQSVRRRKGKRTGNSRDLVDVSEPHRSMMTSIIAQLWSYVRVAGADMIRSTVEPSLKSLPGAFRFSVVDLGDAPLQMDNIRVHPLNDGVVQMDMDIVWDGKCRIELASSVVAVGVEEIKFSGRMCMLFKPLTNKLPVVQALSYAFVNPPVVDLKYTGLARMASMKLIDETVKDSIDAGLLSMVLPNRSLYRVGSNVDFLEAYHPPLGVARLTMLRGRGFVVERHLLGKDDVPDVYCKVSLGQTTKRTRTIRDDVAPEWREALDFCVCDRGQTIRIEAWDEDQGPLDPDDDLGVAEISVGDLLLSGRQAELELFDADNGKPTGAFVTIRCDMCRWTTDERVVSSWELTREEADVKQDAETGTNGGGMDGKSSNEDNLIRGLLVVVVPQAFNVPPGAVGSSLLMKVSYQDRAFQTVAVPCPSNNPQYDAYFDVPLTSKMVERGMTDGEEGDSVTLELMRQDNSKSPLPPPVVEGSAKVKIVDVLHSPRRTLTRTVPLEGASIGGAAVSVRVQLCGVQRTSDDATVNLHGSPPASVLSPEYGKRVGSTGTSAPSSGAVSDAARPQTSGQRLSSSSSPPPVSTVSKIQQQQQHQHHHVEFSTDESVISTASSYGTMTSSYLTDDAPRLAGGAVKVFVLKGRGFRLLETFFGVAMPDLYCLVRLSAKGSSTWSSSSSSSSSSVKNKNKNKTKQEKNDGSWLTSTQLQSLSPDWNGESHTFDCGSIVGDAVAKVSDHVLEVSVFSESSNQGFSRGPRQRPESDRLVGSARTTVGEVMSRDGGVMEVELLGKDGERTESFVALRCEVV